MNLNAYDVINRKNRTWINSLYKKLYSYDIKYHPFYTFVERYNEEYKCYDLFLVLLEEINPKLDCKTTIRAKNNLLVKIDLSTIWNKFGKELKLIEQDVNLDIVEDDDDGTIYKLV